MLFQVDPRSPAPVYQQIVDQVKQAVIDGAVEPDEQLPPIRDVAVEIRANRNTVARAYIELEREGVIYTQTGRGAFISRDSRRICAAYGQRLIRERLAELLELADRFQVSRADLREWIGERKKAKG